MNYEYISSDEELYPIIERWRNKDRIAVDFEGEFNLHVYGEHLCLIQVFDGEYFTLIDPRSKEMTKNGLEAFFSIGTEKVWFDCQSDASLVYKQYGLIINNIFDIRVLAKLLGSSGNLISLEKEYLGLSIEINKKKNQQANWLKRPIDEELIEYALLDVAHLMELKDALVPAIAEKNLDKQAKSAMKKALEIKKPAEPWKHVVNWKMISPKERIYVRNLFLARDGIARRFNVPAYYVMDKRRIGELAEYPPKDKDMLKVRIACEPKRFMPYLEPALWNAIEKSKIEISTLK